MDFSSFNAAAREVANGTLALSALLLIIIFGNFSWRHRRSFRASGTVQAAVAILVLMTGHFIRASGAWTEFAWRRSIGEFDENWGWTWFVTAAVMIIVGKGMMVYTFAPVMWRWFILAVGFPFCLLAPLVFVTMW